jgi:hypothetical protein
VGFFVFAFVLVFSVISPTTNINNQSDVTAAAVYNIHYSKHSF